MNRFGCDDDELIESSDGTAVAIPVASHSALKPATLHDDDRSFKELFDDDFIKHQQQILARIESETSKPARATTDSHPTDFLDQKIPAKPWNLCSSAILPLEPDRDTLRRGVSLLAQSSVPVFQSSMSSFDLQSHSDVLLNRGCEQRAMFDINYPCDGDVYGNSHFRCVTPTTAPSHDYCADADYDDELKSELLRAEKITNRRQTSSSFTHFLQDAVIIREQARILEQIQVEHQQHRRRDDEHVMEQHKIEHAGYNSPPWRTEGSDKSTNDENELIGSSRSLKDYARYSTNVLDLEVAKYAASRLTSRHIEEMSSDPSVMTVLGIQTTASIARSSHDASARISSSSSSGQLKCHGVSLSSDPYGMSMNQELVKGSKLSSTFLLRHYHQTGDKVVKVGQRKLRVKGTKNTFDAIAHGKAIILQCPACTTILQVSETAKLLYCSICQNVTPVHLAKDQSLVDPSQTSASAQVVSTSSLDSQIARTLQEQEMDIACARKLASSNAR